MRETAAGLELHLEPYLEPHLEPHLELCDVGTQD
jgi:hypothetical protein